MSDSFNIIYNFYVEDNNIPYIQLEKKGEIFFDQYPYNWQNFLVAVSSGSEIDLKKVKILNAMETINSSVNEQRDEIAGCVFKCA